MTAEAAREGAKPVTAPQTWTDTYRHEGRRFSEVKKVLTIQVSVTLSERKNGSKRLKRASEQAGERAIEVLQDELVSGSVDAVDITWDYSYNALSGNQAYEMVEGDVADGEDEDEDA